MEELERMFEQLKVEYAKFNEKQNKAAGTRARIVAQEMKFELSKIRTQIQSTKKEM